MIYIGCDCSSNGYGVVVMDQDNNIVYKVVLIRAKNITETEHFKNIYEELNNIFNTYKPNHVAIEDVYFGINAATAKLLSRIGGITISVALIHNIDVDNIKIINTNTMKAHVLKGYPKTDEKLKIQTHRKICKDFALDEEKTKTDISDAIGLILTYKGGL